MMYDQKLQLLPAEEQKCFKIKCIEVTFVLFIHSGSNIKKVAFQGRAWTLRESKGAVRVNKAQGQVQGKGTTARKTSRQEAEANLKVASARCHTLVSGSRQITKTHIQHNTMQPGFNQ